MAKTTPTPASPSTVGTSFAKVAAARRRLIVAVDGLEKCGKSHFALTAPGPIAVLNFDIGLEGVADKFVLEGKHVMTANYDVPEGIANTQAMADAADRIWQQMVKDYYWALKHVRTVVLDTATEVWELLRLARFGKLTQVMPHHYGPVNAEYRKLIRAAYDHDANLVLLHKLKPEYETKVVNNKEVSNRTGRYVRAGMGDTGFLVQLNALAYRGDTDPLYTNDSVKLSLSPGGDFNLFIRDCRQNGTIGGTTIPQPLLTFPQVAQMVLEDSTEEDWS